MVKISQIIKGKWLGYNWKVHSIYEKNVKELFLIEAIGNVIGYSQKGRVNYLNCPCSFDIETSSWIDDSKKKHSIMYIWQFGLNGVIVYGRKWEEFFELLQYLDEKLELGYSRRLVIYVHNLMFEFQFIRKWINWDKVFAPNNRRPLYALAGGFEFRCSYYLSNFSLEYIGENLLNVYPVKKLVGNLDYYKIRNCNTRLTKEELDYCINDVKVVMSYIQEKIENEDGIANIPLTNTGYVRNYCRRNCIPDNYSEYKKVMKELTLQDEVEYEELHAAFRGGFTHASILWVNKIIEEPVGSGDLTSSYPYAMVAQYFPMSKSEYIGSCNGEEFEEYLNEYCCLFDIRFTGLKPIVNYENYIPFDRTEIKGKFIENNGRLVSADECALTMTELDFGIVKRLYTWESIEIKDLRIYERGYLPRELIVSILNLYESKTSLKGVVGKELEYLVSKGMINSAYGMMVMAVLRIIYDYEEDWIKKEIDKGKQIDSYNKAYNRFLYYPWGVWVTAHARDNLWNAIFEFKEDFVYADTDSIKGVNFIRHLKFFEEYNKNVERSLKAVCEYYNIDYTKCSPKTKKGEEKLLGVWEMEEGYRKFKTCGAKRYLYTYEDGFTTMTNGGLTKSKTMPYLIAKWNNIDLNSQLFEELLERYKLKNGEDRKWIVNQNFDYTMIFEVYGDGMYIPPEYSGKLESTYIDSEDSGFIVDYQGNIDSYKELSSLHIGKTCYFMSMPFEFLKLIQNVEELTL